MEEKIEVPHLPITEQLLYEWGHTSPTGGFVNWNGMWLRKTKKGWEYGDPNYYKVDKKHPFIKKGDIFYMDELDALQRLNGRRGLEHKDYKYLERAKEWDYKVYDPNATIISEFFKYQWPKIIKWAIFQFNKIKWFFTPPLVNKKDQRIYDYVFSLLKYSSDREVLEYGWNLNRWCWPFPQYADYYNSMPYLIKEDGKSFIKYGNHTRYEFQRPISNYCHNRIGKKEELRYHNVKKIKSMDNEAFEKWWLEREYEDA